LLNENHENSEHQKPNIKWFDRLTILSKVEGQIPMIKIQNRRNGHVTSLNHYLLKQVDFYYD